MKRSVNEIDLDSAFAAPTETSKIQADRAPLEIEPFDAKKLDAIPRSLLQSLHLLHENFARNLASSLSAYLRSYVMMNLVSLEQLSYGDLLESMSSPACIAYISMQPYDGTAVLDINTNLVFRLLELLLGSKDQTSIAYQRKITDIEKKLMQTLLRVVLHDLQDSWRRVAEINFSVQSLVSEPQLLYLLAPTEAMIMIAIEVRLGTVSGLMNLAIPAIFVKRLRSHFDQLQQIRKAEPTEQDQLRIAELLQEAKLTLEVQIPGGTVRAQTLIDLKAGDVLLLDHQNTLPLPGRLNGKEKWLGRVTAQEEQLVFQVTGARPPA